MGVLGFGGELLGRCLHMLWRLGLVSLWRYKGISKIMLKLN